MKTIGAEPGGGASKQPRLLVDARPEALGAIDPARRLLGLSLLRRLALAARRAGFGEILVVAPAGAEARLRPLLAGLPGIAFANRLPSEPGARPTLLASADLLGETAWLAELAALPLARTAILEAEGLRLLGPSVAPAEAASRPGQGEPLALATLPLRLRREADLAAAERRLLRALRKPTDGFMARRFARPISIALSRRLAPLGVRPNQMTLLSMLIGLAAAPCFLSAQPAWQIVGALLFVAHSVLDGCDGELARLTFHETRLGGLLDFASDNVVHVAVFACMALGWSAAIAADWPLLLGLGAVLGTGGSAFVVYWTTLRRKAAGNGPVYTSVTAAERANRLSRMLDELSRRDFIYLVPALALFGKAQWLVALGGVGAPVFLLLLAVAATG